MLFSIATRIVSEDIFEIQYTNAMAKERIGYPTQKPEALLERIIKASSNEGDLILYPFMGGGTTMAIADKLNRKWIGIDQSVMAVKVTAQRLQKQNGQFESIEYNSLDNCNTKKQSHEKNNCTRRHAIAG